MQISTLKHDNPQLRLFDEPLGNHGHVRYILGDFVETLTAELFRGTRHSTGHKQHNNKQRNNSDQQQVYYAPDICCERYCFCCQNAHYFYLECKATGRSNQFLIYQGRLEKDRIFAETHQLFYCIWHHNTNTLLYSSTQELRDALLSHLRGIYIIPFLAVDEAAKSRRVQKLNSHYGNSDGNPVYGCGITMPLSLFNDFKVAEFLLERK